MSSVTQDTGAPALRRHDWNSEAHLRRVRSRYAANRRMQIYGLLAIALSVGLLGTLLVSLAATGYKAFYQTKASLEIFVDPQVVGLDATAVQRGLTDDEKRKLGRANFRKVFNTAVLRYVPGIAEDEESHLTAIFSSEARYVLRDYVVANPSAIGTTVTLSVPLSDAFDQYVKGVIPRHMEGATPGERTLDAHFSSEKQFEWLEKLQAQGLIRPAFAWELFFNANSTFPELAGLAGAAIGSAYALFVCFLIAFPVGIAAAVYLEEFAGANRFTSLIEVNINNLAAVPSVVFGLLGLALFLNFFGLPRSAPLVGGMVLALMTLPTIIITTRAALKAVPPSIREAALGVGASRHQVVLHHVLPLAMPGVLTGAIIGMARALGETAPLLLVGMNAFIPAIGSAGLLDAATAMSTQIYGWAGNNERGFEARTSAAILILLAFLVAMNALAIFLRQRFERKW